MSGSAFGPEIPLAVTGLGQFLSKLRFDMNMAIHSRSICFSFLLISSTSLSRSFLLVTSVGSQLEFNVRLLA